MNKQGSLGANKFYAMFMQTFRERVKPSGYKLLKKGKVILPC